MVARTASRRKSGLGLGDLSGFVCTMADFPQVSFARGDRPAESIAKPADFPQIIVSKELRDRQAEMNRLVCGEQE